MPASSAWEGQEGERLARLKRMQRFATGLLVAMTALFAVASFLERRYPWVGFVRAIAEAAMVGGVADWFAVTALFRHPLGVPIPHTAIIPARKDRIGRSLGGFVQANFLSRSVLTARLQAFRPSERLARWLVVPENARRISRHAASALAGAANVLKDEDVQALIDRSLVSRIRRTRVAPLLGNALALVTAGDRHQRLLDEVIRLIATTVDQHEDLIRDRIRAETPWWIPEAVDERIHIRVVAAIDHTLQEVDADPLHPLRKRFDDAVHHFIESLRHSPEAAEKAEAIKEELLAHPVVQQFSASLWADVKAAILRRAADPDAAPGALEQALQTVGETLLADEALQAKADQALTTAVLSVVDQYRDGVAQFIAHTVEQWDPDVTSRKIELAIGRDLQFIRINGTLVGGLVGLILYSIGRAF
ncbi:MAG: DUF445 domain-containing protein [Gemmatimonadaceae bacterium]